MSRLALFLIGLTNFSASDSFNSLGPHLALIVKLFLIFTPFTLWSQGHFASLNWAASTTSGLNAVSSVSLEVGGSGYSVNDVLTLGSGTAAVLINSVDGSGSILTFSITVHGFGYSLTTVTPSGGTGSDALFDITGLTQSVSGYNVYRSSVKGQEHLSSALNGGTPISATTYIDNTITYGQPYFYVITAVTIDGVESADSTEASGGYAGRSSVGNTTSINITWH